MATITRFTADLLSGVNSKTGLGGSVNQSPIGPGGGQGYVYAPVTKVVVASTDPNPYVYVATETDTLIEVDATNQNVQVVLPNATVSQGQYKMVKRSDATFAAGNTVTIVDAASNNVEGAASQTLNAQNAIFEARADGSQWQCIGGSNSAAWGGNAPIAAITVGASPYAYTAAAAGTVVVSGGTVSAITLKRGAPAAISVGETSGVIPVSAGDIVTVTYSAAPTMSFVPR
jgi:hypothetical protein